MGENTADLATVITANGLLKLAKQSGNVEPPSDTTEWSGKFQSDV